MPTDLEADITEIVRRTQPRLRTVLIHFGVPEDDVGDILQEAVLQLVRKRATIIEPGTWLVGTVRRECLYYWRRKRQRLTLALTEAHEELLIAPENQERDVLRHDIARAIRTLRPRCQRVIQHRFFLGSSTAETASQAGCTPSSLDKILRRCLDNLSHRMLRIGRRFVAPCS